MEIMQMFTILMSFSHFYREDDEKGFVQFASIFPYLNLGVVKNVYLC